MKRSRSSWAAITAVLVMLLVGILPGGQAVAEPTASVRLFALDDDVTIRRAGRRVSLAQLGLWVTSVGGGFELRVWRDLYRAPIEIAQFDAETGTEIRPLPADVLAGWTGLADFFRAGVFNAQGRKVASLEWTFCPNQWERQRLHDGGPTAPIYPPLCTNHPLTKGTVWGIEDGWAVPALSYFEGPSSFRLPNGHYTVRVGIARRYRDLFDIPAEDATAVIDLTLLPRRTSAPQSQRGSAAEMQRSAEVPDDTDPDPSTLPDLRPLPAWGFGTAHRGSRDFLTFGATEWNAGPSPLVVEGFRRSSEPVMDAFQYFYPDADGPPVGRAPVGSLEYHQGGGHNHWHFEEFTEYTLLDASGEQVVRSGKQSWCLVPTDPVDLTVPGANWSPWSVGIGTACGGPDAIWIREYLDAGWGDTYFQYSSGQAFDITGLPNGRYFVKVEVNPTGSLYERSYDNNVRRRRVRLAGEPGERRVIVPLWRGIDTENLFGGGCCVEVP